MAGILFPDNCVLRSFAEVYALDLLEQHLRGRGRWTDAIEAEVHSSLPHAPGLAGLVERRWLGEPIALTSPVDMKNVMRIRRLEFNRGPDKPSKDLGEAQTLWLMQSREEFAGAWWVSEDRASLQYARRAGIATRETIDMVRGIVADGLLTPRQGFDLMQRMKALGRGPRMPRSAEDLES